MEFSAPDIEWKVEVKVEVLISTGYIYTVVYPISVPYFRTYLASTSIITMSEAIASFTKEHTLSERSIKENNRERKKRVVVTGGSGRLGRCVVREMAEHGWEVYNCTSSLLVPMNGALILQWILYDQQPLKLMWLPNSFEPI